MVPSDRLTLLSVSIFLITSIFIVFHLSQKLREPLECPVPSVPSVPPSPPSCPSPLPSPPPFERTETWIEWNSSWKPLIPILPYTIPEFAISRPIKSIPRLDFSKALENSLSDSEIWNLSKQRCNGKGLYVYNSPAPWCDCFWGWRGSTCESPLKRAVKTAVLFLAYGSDNYLVEILKTVQGMERYWVAHKGDFDILIFGDKRTLESTSLLDKIRAASSHRVVVHEIWIDLPLNGEVRDLFSGRSDLDARPLKNPSCWHSMGYAHMNRFFSVQMFSHPVFFEYDYILRIDSHMYTKADLPCNIFKMAAQSNAVLSFLRSGIDKEDCMNGIREVSLDYALSNDFSPNHLQYSYAPNATGYAGAFLVFKTSFWRHPEVTRFLHHWDQSGWIYLSRTSDQVLFQMLTALFVPEFSVLPLCDFPEVFEHREAHFPFHPCPSHTSRCIT